MIGYHVSSICSRKNILRYGFRASKQWTPHVFFWKTLRDAIWFAEYETSPMEDYVPKLIWKVNLRGLRVEPDPETADMTFYTHHFDTGEAFTFKNPVPKPWSGMMTKDRVGPERIIAVGQVKKERIV